MCVCVCARARARDIIVFAIYLSCNYQSVALQHTPHPASQSPFIDDIVYSTSILVNYGGNFYFVLRGFDFHYFPSFSRRENCCSAQDFCLVVLTLCSYQIILAVRGMCSAGSVGVMITLQPIESHSFIITLNLFVG